MDLEKMLGQFLLNNLNKEMQTIVESVKNNKSEPKKVETMEKEQTEVKEIKSSDIEDMNVLKDTIKTLQAELTSIRTQLSAKDDIIKDKESKIDGLKKSMNSAPVEEHQELTLDEIIKQGLF